MGEKIEINCNGSKGDTKWVKCGEKRGRGGLLWCTPKENIRTSLRHKANSQKLLPDKLWKFNPYWKDAGANGQITDLSMIIFSNFNWFW